MMELSLYSKSGRDSQVLALTAATALLGTAPTNGIRDVVAVIWATTAFCYAVGANPSAQKPVVGTPGDVTLPAGVPVRINIPAGLTLAAAALTGTGELYVNVGA